MLAKLGGRRRGVAGLRRGNGSFEERRVLQTLEDEQIIPVRVHRFGRVALVADRLRDHAVEGSVLVSRGHALVTEPVDESDHSADRGQHALHERAISRVPVVLGDEVDELPMAVVLGNRVGSRRADATRDVAVLADRLRVPLDEFAHDLILTESQQRLRRERSVADPGALVRSGARVDGLVVAVEKNVAALRLDALREPRLRRKVQRE